MSERTFATMPTIVLNCGSDPRARRQTDELLNALIEANSHSAKRIPEPELNPAYAISLTMNGLPLQRRIMYASYSTDTHHGWIYNTNGYYQTKDDVFQVSRPLPNTVTMHLQVPSYEGQRTLPLPFGTRPIAYLNNAHNNPFEFLRHSHYPGAWSISSDEHIASGTQIFLDHDLEFLHQKPTPAESQPLACFERLPEAWQDLLYTIKHDRDLTQAQRLSVLAYAWADVFEYDYNKLGDTPDAMHDSVQAQGVLSRLLSRFSDDRTQLREYPEDYDDNPAQYVSLASGNCVDISGGFMIMSRFIGIPSRYVGGKTSYSGNLLKPIKLDHAYNAVFLDGVWQAFEPQHPSLYQGQLPAFPQHYDRLIREIPRH